MNTLIKFNRLRFFVISAFVVLLASYVAAKEPDAGLIKNSQTLKKSEVLTSVEQRMQKNISVDFSNTPIDEVLRVMAEQANVDIVKSPQVVGNVTATLTDIPLQEALNNILVAHNYGYVTTNNMIRIAPADQLSVNAERLVNRIYRITYADVIEVEKALKKFISKNGSLSSNSGTSNIIVTDSESKIKAIDTFINEVDRITPQILVEARIYDITSRDSLDLGITWSAGRVSGKNNPFIDGAFGSGISKSAGTTGTLNFGILNKSLDIDILLTAAQEEDCAKLLANPRILVLDNETANIKIISEIPYQELTQTSGGGNIGTTEFKEVGVELEVTPHVTRDGMIRLHLIPKFSVEVRSVNLIIPQIGVDAITSPQPVIDSREAETITLIKDGQTVVIGGLRKQEAKQESSKIPMLGDLPVIGGLFKFEGEENTVSELVIFITARIIHHPTLNETETEQLEATEICSPKCSPTKVGRCNE